ncbi:acyl-CoA dehydrogenase family protein [Salisaeta longa]|uniref:acyl-CoA dehydrogenase family protein n=1 Tax=Salisaeta longa TaxID=503170 RepID=UPI0003B3922D|nr:acyl-CoA dehydrogenase family protein [Salisaeta longa]
MPAVEALPLDALQTFLHDHVEPLEDALRTDGWPAVADDLAAVQRAVKARGWWCPQLPEAEGGMGLSLEDFARVSEVLGRSPLGHVAFNCQAPDAGNMELLAAHATPAQRERFLDPLVGGRLRSCFAMTEPEHAGSNPKHLSTTATPTDDGYRLRGHKWFTTGAHGAAFAIVMAVTHPDADDPYAWASMLLVPMDANGVEHVQRLPIMGERGAGWLSHSELRFHDVVVPPAHVLGPPGRGFALAQERLGPGRIHHCMRWIGICERAFAMMCERAATRVVRDGETLSQQQSFQHAVAECRASIDAARLLVLNAAQTIARDGARAARTDISTIKFFVADVLHRVLDEAIQAHGAYGLTDDTLLSFWYRHERGASIYDGPSEVHKNVVARRILRTYE